MTLSPMVEHDVAENSTSAVTDGPKRNQVGEMVRMLNLAAGQVEGALRDSNASVAILTDSFTSMAGSLEAIEAALGSLPPHVQDAVAKADLHTNTREVASRVQQSIIAFQFYDRLVQRLSHVSQALSALSELAGDGSRSPRSDAWQGLHGQVRNMYTMAEERTMFDALMGGASLAEVLASEAGGGAGNTDSGGGDIELF